MTMPVASPSHQVIQCTPNSAQGIWPASTSVRTPLLAATSAAPNAITANFHTAAGASKRYWKLTNRRISRPATTASAALPAPIASATHTGVPMTPRFAIAAPIMIAGQMRPPNASHAASAMPAGGHTALAYPGGIANASDIAATLA